MIRPIFAVGIVTVLIGLAGCAHAEGDKTLDQKVDSQSEIKGSTDLNEKTRQTIANSPGITDDQRTKLLQLHAETVEKMNGIREESLKLRALLVEDLVDKDYNAAEIRRIEKRLRTTDAQRTDTIIAAVKQVNTILGRAHPQSAEIMRQFINDHEERGERK